MSDSEDLKIDIYDLFGGDLSEARQAAEQLESMETPTETAPAEDTASAEPDSTAYEIPPPETASSPETSDAAGLGVETPLPTEEAGVETDAVQGTVETFTAEGEAIIQTTESVSPAPEMGTEEAAAPLETPTEVSAEPAVAAPDPATADGPVEIDFNSFSAKPFVGFPLSPVLPVGAQTETPPPPPLKDERAEILTKIEIPSKAEGDVEPSPEEAARLKRELDFLEVYDQFRRIIREELRDLVGDKKTKTMLSRTLDSTRNRYPEYFRNANYDAEGNLLQDGSIDEQRLIHNKSLLSPSQADVVQDTALGALLDMRLQAVEKGLGTGMRTKIQARIRQTLVSKRELAVRKGEPTSPYDRMLAMVV